MAFPAAAAVAAEAAAGEMPRTGTGAVDSGCQRLPELITFLVHLIHQSREGLQLEFHALGGGELGRLGDPALVQTHGDSEHIAEIRMPDADPIQLRIWASVPSCS